MARKATVIELRRDTRPISDRIDEYLADKRADGLLTKTRRFYEAVLRKQAGSFLNYCKDQGATELAKIDDDFLKDWTRWMHERPALPTAPGVEPRTRDLSDATKKTYVRTVKTFLKWARKEGYLPHVRDLDDVKVPKVRRQPYDVLSRKEAELMENTARDERDKLIIRLLWETGMRASELCGLHVQDLREKTHEYFIRVRGKGRHVRDVPVKPETFKRLRKYVENARPDPDLDAIWQGARIDPRKHVTVAMTPSGLGQMLQSVAERAGIDPKRTHPHAWRHSCATYMILNRHMRESIVQQILGHADLRTIMVYTHLSASASYKALVAAHAQPDEED